VGISFAEKMIFCYTELMERIKSQERILDCETKIHFLEQECAILKERNARLEREKVWEGSRARIVLVTIFTYIVFIVTLHILGATQIFVSALIPAIGLFLSLQSFPIIKKWWIHRFIKEK